jgi:hypothetical protein
VETARYAAKRSVAFTVMKCMLVQSTYIKLRVQELDSCHFDHGARSFWLER